MKGNKTELNSYDWYQNILILKWLALYIMVLR